VTRLRVAVAAAGALVLLLVVALLVVTLTGSGDPSARVGDPATGTSTGTGSPDPGEPPDGVDPDDTAYDAGLSEPREDSVYPNVGDPGMDALHYGLDLAWDPEERLLDATATVVLRATGRAPELRLDLGDPLEVTAVTLDGEDVEWEHNGKDLVVLAPVAEDERYVLAVDYEGEPEPTRAPTTRQDLSTTGWTVTPEGEVWTMQEPYGAFTWYPVNDQPSDKALYDFTITVPSPWVGVANGELESREEVGGDTVTRWHLGAAASSYLVTIGIGDMVMTEDESPGGVPITYWTPRGDDASLRALRETPEALAWSEEKLGDYPLDTPGVLVVDSESGMETQTMITLGATPYATSPPVLVHEIVHHWYGNLVSPTDWRDVWMNEGMTMYLQGQFEADTTGRDVGEVMDDWATYEAGMREEAGPPGAYDPRSFAEGNIYYGPALMWHELRERIGDKRFWSMVRAWPSVDAGGNATREEYLAWVEEETGEELTAFFDAWLLGETTPPRD
jgi:aminopeptidase N